MNLNTIIIENKIQVGINEETKKPEYVYEDLYLPKIKSDELLEFRESLKLNKKNRDLPKSTEKLVELLNKNYKFKSIRSENTQEIWAQINNVYKPIGRSLIHQFCRQMCGEEYKENISNDVAAKIEGDNFIDSSLFFNSVYDRAIIVKNGVLDLKTKKLSKNCGDQIHFNTLPIVYNPAAQCPAIEKFFKGILEDKTDIETMYELIGYILYKDSFIEKAAMLLGTTRNGKSKTIDLIMALIGKENVSKLTLKRVSEDKSAVHMLQNRMVNLSGDISGAALKDVSSFKELCGRDEISGFRKFKDDVEFKPYAKLIFATNKLPALEEDDSGFWTKWIILNFPYTFVPKSLLKETLNSTPEDKKKYVKIQDPFILQKLTTKEELSGLLNKALKGLDRLLINKDFSSNQSAQSIQKQWTRNSNIFAAFLLDNIEKRRHHYIDPEDLNTKYIEYCEKLEKDPMLKAYAKTMNLICGSVSVTKRFDGFNKERFWSNVKFKNQKDVEPSKDGTMFRSIPYSQEEEVIENAIAAGSQKDLRQYTK